VIQAATSPRRPRVGALSRCPRGLGILRLAPLDVEPRGTIGGRGRRPSGRARDVVQERPSVLVVLSIRCVSKTRDLQSVDRCWLMADDWRTIYLTTLLMLSRPRVREVVEQQSSGRRGCPVRRGRLLAERARMRPSAALSVSVSRPRPRPRSRNSAGLAQSESLGPPRFRALHLPAVIDRGVGSPLGRRRE